MRIFDRKTVGLLAPLFSVRSGLEWGVGELPDLVTLARWARRGGFSWVLTLPLLEPSPGQESPYAACSFYALDPLYIAVRDVPEFAALGGIETLDAEERLTLTAVSESPSVDHRGVRWLKMRVLRRCFAHLAAQPATDARRKALARFETEEAKWLEPYVLFRAIKEVHPEGWRSWPTGLRDGDAAAVKAFRAEHASELAFRRYLQWVAVGQLAAAREGMHAHGVSLFGDEPFLVADDSADVWAHRELFRFDATVGAPPDAFSADGQEWGLPPYRWDALEKRRYDLFTARGAHTARLYDGVRIDHVVGLYRTYHRPIDKSPHYFYPDTQAAQLAQGEAVLRALASAGTEILAEDLGVIPPFVRQSLASLGIPGYRVVRWEQEAGRFRDPASYPALSVATTGTHDTESSIDWWEQLPEIERKAALALPALAPLDGSPAAPHAKLASEPPPPARFTQELWRALLETAIGSASCAVLLPIHDVLHLRDRVNTPNTVGPLNWSVRLPWTIEALEHDAIVEGRMRWVRATAAAHGR
ncbi:MAG: 4-alpha-glucanotransferase [Sandaracinaceae bacterium]|nr:4-alpha-glucanotransferase [Sandaracinaceae bacterium]